MVNKFNYRIKAARRYFSSISIPFLLQSKVPERLFLAVALSFPNSIQKKMK